MIVELYLLIQIMSMLPFMEKAMDNSHFTVAIKTISSLQKAVLTIMSKVVWEVTSSQQEWATTLSTPMQIFQIIMTMKHQQQQI